MERARHFSSSWRRRAILVSLLALPLLLFAFILLRSTPVEGLGATSAPEVGAAGASTGFISGTVTNQSGAPIQLIRVSACNPLITGTCTEYKFTYTDADGKYLLDDIATGASYKIRFKDFDLTYRDESYYNNSATITNATPVNVFVGVVTPNIDGKLTHPSRITGRVVDSGGNPIEGVFAQVCDLAFTVQCTGPTWSPSFSYSDPDGYYDMNRLIADTYKVMFSKDGYLPEFYNDKIDFADAVPVTVGIEGHVTLSDTMLVTASNIQGTVKNDEGDPIEGAHLQFVALNGSVAFGHETIGDGSYLTRDMPAGEYIIDITDPSGTYLSKQINFTVDEGVLETLDVVLEEARKIHGYVTDAGTTGAYEGAYISACPTTLDCTLLNSWDAHYATSDIDGKYEIGGLTSGNYYVRFDPLDADYLTEYHFNALNLADATFVPLDGETHVVQVDAALNGAPGVSGQVMTSASPNDPIEDITVTICRKTGDSCPSLNSASTDSLGNYSFSALLPGTYLLKFDDYDGVAPQYLTKVYDANSADLADATAIVLANTQVTGKDVQLLRGVVISGTLLLPGGAPAVGARATVCRVDGGDCTPLNEHIVDVDANGAWQITGLRNGVDYRVQFLSPSVDYLSFYLNFSSPVFVWQSAANINRSAEEVVDFGPRTFPVAATISGRVIDDDHAPLEGIVVKPCYINLGNPCTIGGETTTNANGEYTIRGLRPAPPAYYVQFSDPAGIYATLFYTNATNIIDGAPLTPSLGQAIEGIGMVLPRLAEVPTATPVTPTPSTPTVTPSATPTGSITPTPSATPSATPTASPTPLATFEVEPNQPVTLTIGAAQGLAPGQSIEVQIPAGAVNQPTNFSIGLAAPQGNTQFGLGKLIFYVEPRVGSAVVENFVFEEPITVTITYRDEDIQGLAEPHLTLRYFDELSSAWRDDGIELVRLDLEQNRIVLRIHHLTLFALYDASERVLLPVVGGR